MNYIGDPEFQTDYWEHQAYVLLLQRFNKRLFFARQTLLAAAAAVCQSMSANKSSPYSFPPRNPLFSASGPATSSFNGL
jgi:hypothetical protein